MQLFQFQMRIAVIVYLFLFCLSADVFTQQIAIFSQNNGAIPAEFSQSSLAGNYTFSNHRKNKGGFENSLTIVQGENGRLRVSFEGTYFYLAGGDETFHESSAAGNFTMKGTTASGRFVEEGSDNTCFARLAFLNETVTLTSSNCDLNTSPDGTYKKSATPKTYTDVSLRPIPTPKRQSAHGKYQPFIQYDADDNPEAILNLMSTREERVGCEEKVLTFTGKLVALDNSEELVYEFTLVDGNRKRQKISLVIGKEDKLRARDLHAIIKVGANLTVKYLNCGNAPIASPTAIYKK
jgi:hypothetical protein